MSVGVVVAPDGSPVELYARLGGEREVALLLEALPAAARVLDLGVGTGRIADPLVEAGMAVVGVDDSDAMLARVRRATPALGSIAGLDLRTRFDAVLLLSHLVNTDDDDERAAFLATVARHLAPLGVAIIERHDPRWAATVADGPLGDRDGVAFAVEGVARHGDRLRATSIYAFDRQEVRQAWTARVLDDEALDAAFAAAGLRLVDFLDARRTLARATLAAR